MDERTGDLFEGAEVVVDTGSEVIAAGSFDYAALPAEHIAGARECAAWVRSTLAKLEADTIETMTVVGARLLEAKEAIGHGGFMKWVEAECGLSQTHANRAMSLAENFGLDQIRHVTNLPRTLVYALAKPAAETVRLDVVSKAKTGIAPSASDIEAELSKLREAAKAARRETPQERKARIEKERKTAIRHAKGDLAEHEARAKAKSERRALAEKLAGLLLAGLTDAEMSELRASYEPLGAQSGAEYLGRAILEALHPSLKEERQQWEVQSLRIVRERLERALSA